MSRGEAPEARHGKGIRHPLSPYRTNKNEEKTMGAQKEAIKMAIKDEIMSRFRRANAKPGDMLSVTWLYDDFLPSLSDKENQASEVLDEMINAGLLKYIDGPKVTYALTPKGEEGLCEVDDYQSRSDKLTTHLIDRRENGYQDMGRGEGDD